MDKPTEAQVKEFWEWCGFEEVHYNSLGAISEKWSGRFPEEKRVFLDWVYLPIDLNSLFQYAKNMFFERGWSTSWYDLLSQWVTFMFNNQDEDPALALFWALWKVKEE